MQTIAKENIERTRLIAFYVFNDVHSVELKNVQHCTAAVDFALEFLVLRSTLYPSRVPGRHIASVFPSKYKNKLLGGVIKRKEKGGKDINQECLT
jgi:hypothetical protein